jgi:hypothetical protein
MTWAEPDSKVGGTDATQLVEILTTQLTVGLQIPMSGIWQAV